MQQVLDHWAQRRSGVVPPELIGRIAPTRTEGINLRGVFRFPVERYGVTAIKGLLCTPGASKYLILVRSRTSHFC
jgi:hypothetical protein